LSLEKLSFFPVTLSELFDVVRDFTVHIFAQLYVQVRSFVFLNNARRKIVLIERAAEILVSTLWTPWSRDDGIPYLHGVLAECKTNILDNALQARENVRQRCGDRYRCHIESHQPSVFVLVTSFVKMVWVWTRQELFVEILILVKNFCLCFAMLRTNRRHQAGEDKGCDDK